MNNQFNNAAQPTPTFGQTPFNGAPAQPGFNNAPAQAPQFGQQAPGFGGAPTQGFGGVPSFQAPNNKPTASYSPVSAADLNWISQEEDAQYATLENNFEALQSMQKAYPLQVTGNVIFSALAKPFLPKLDNGYGRQWTLKVALDSLKLEDGYDHFAAYIFAKRLSRNDSTGQVTYNWSQTIPGTDQNVTVDQAKQMGRENKTADNKPSPVYPIWMADKSNMSRVEEVARDFASDGTQQITLSLNIARSKTKRPAMAKYMFYKPWLQGVFVDIDSIKYNEFGGGSNPFQVAQQQMLAQYAQQQGVVGAETLIEPTAQALQNTQAPQAAPFGQATQAPQAAPFGQVAQAPQAAPFGQVAQAPQAAQFGQAAQAAPFGQAAQAPQAAPFGQAAQAPQAAPFGQADPFASPFATPTQDGANPFLNN